MAIVVRRALMMTALFILIKNLYQLPLTIFNRTLAKESSKNKDSYLDSSKYQDNYSHSKINTKSHQK